MLPKIPAITFAVLVWSMTLTSRPAFAQWLQQGPKSVGAGAVGTAAQGASVSISADGNTAIVGGNSDDTVPLLFCCGVTGTGAAWVWTRSAGVWTQQGNKLVGSGAVGFDPTEQGYSVAVSADGNTAAVGGPYDNNDAGATWIWTRSGGVWTQQGNKLVGSGAVGLSGGFQGCAVALSADGNTLIAGGLSDKGYTGAAWVWTRSGGVWTQQGNKLVGSDAVATLGQSPAQGASVSLSADGNTAIIGGPYDNGNAGAAWIWTRSNEVWTQQGNKLVGYGADVGEQGFAVSLSADGNTAIVGGPNDGNRAGAVWIWSRTGEVWTQQGNKLVGSGAVGSAYQGYSVSLSGDGNTAVVGGIGDNDRVGATWVWTRTGGIWTQEGNKLIGSGAAGTSTQGFVDLSADGKTVIIGGASDNNGVGAVWVFALPQPSVRIRPSRPPKH